MARADRVQRDQRESPLLHAHSISVARHAILVEPTNPSNPGILVSACETRPDERYVCHMEKSQPFRPCDVPHHSPTSLLSRNRGFVLLQPHAVHSSRVPAISKTNQDLITKDLLDIIQGRVAKEITPPDPNDVWYMI